MIRTFLSSCPAYKDNCLRDMIKNQGNNNYHCEAAKPEQQPSAAFPERPN